MLRNIMYVVVLVLGLSGFYAVLNAWSPVGTLKEEAPVVSTSPNATPIGESSSGQSPSLSRVGSRLSKHLFVLNSSGEAQGFEESKMAGIKYWAFYYSAQWCPPSRAFTPHLVDFYKQFKPSHPDFELVFVSDDRSEADMISYMKNDSMVWPAVRYQDIQDDQVDAQQYAGDDIPDLVLVDGDGRVLSDSYRNGQYVGPQAVIDDIQSVVQ